MYSALATCLALVLVLGVVIDRLYQRFSHKWTNEPPLLPYRIPIVGHALMYGSRRDLLFKTASQRFPGCQPYSLMFFGQRLYVFTHPKDVAAVFRKPKELPFLPLVEALSGLAWGISPDGMKKLSETDEEGDSLFRNAHPFYREALKTGPQLDKLIIGFLQYLQNALDDFDQSIPDEISLFSWTKSMLGTASTNAMMGPSLLRDNPGFLDNVFQVDGGFFFFVNRVPRMFAKKSYQARDHVLAALTKYFANPKTVEESAPMIRDREVRLREKGLTTQDIAAYSFSAYVALITNAKDITYHMVRHVFSHKEDLAKIRAEISPVFASAPAITTLEQVQHLLTSCPLLRAYFDETLRLYAGAPSNRTVVEETSIGDYILKPGHNVMCPSFTQHHSAEYFGQDTDSFNPERFLKPVLDDGKPAKTAMIRAFGGGVSLCSGRHFASNEVLSYAATIIWKYDIEFVGRSVVKIAQRKA